MGQKVCGGQPQLVTPQISDLNPRGWAVVSPSKRSPEDGSKCARLWREKGVAASKVPSGLCSTCSGKQPSLCLPVAVDTRQPSSVLFPTALWQWQADADVNVGTQRKKGSWYKGSWLRGSLGYRQGHLRRESNESLGDLRKFLRRKYNFSLALKELWSAIVKEKGIPAEAGIWARKRQAEQSRQYILMLLKQLSRAWISTKIEN